VSKTDGRFKRFWLNIATNATISGNQAIVTMPSGQKFVSTTLLPANAAIASEVYTNLDAGAYGVYGSLAGQNPMLFRLRVEAPGGPTSTRFLHVLQGADASAAIDSATMVASTNGTPFSGANVAGTVVMFPVSVDSVFNGTDYYVSVTATKHLITGLVPNAGYTVTRISDGTGESVSVSVGGPELADSGGVLVVPSPIRPRLSLSLGVNATLFVESAAGRPVSILSSTNLNDWVILGQATNAPDGRLRFVDGINSGRLPRFYRARVD